GVGAHTSSGWKVYAIAYAEPYAEVGIGLTPWMRLSATLGYQIIGNFVPGMAFTDLLLRSPTLGMTVTWGRF
ncbi:MAG: hypothetical protein Q8M76_08225, partial [Spirochaetaceae bacterium]|nr:hypothetical protein [Spirochaetaceae bacterium]